MEQNRLNGKARAVAAAAPGDTTLDAVRQMMAADERSRQIRGRPVEAPAPKGPDETHSIPARDAARPARAGRIGLAARLAAFEPTKKRGFFLLFVAAMLWKPWLIPGLVGLAFLGAVIAYFTLGPDRVTELTTAGWERFSKRFPERSGRMLAKIQRGADRVDGWLARLPDSWTDGFYLPDLGRSAGTEDAMSGRDDPFERLAAERRAVLGGAPDANGPVKP